MRFKAIILFLMAVTAVTLTANADTTYRVRTHDFSRVKVYDNMSVVCKCNPDSAGYAVFTCDDRLADAFIFSENNGTLSMHVATEYVDVKTLPVVTVYSTFLTCVESSSSGDVKVDKPTGCPEFKCRLIGNGSISINDVNANIVKASLDTGKGSLSISGKCNKAQYKMIGTGCINAEQLESNTALCSVLGTGSISCAPEELLKLRGLGSTTVYYKGNPRKITKAGLGKIVPLK